MRSDRKVIVYNIFGLSLLSVPVLFLDHEILSGARCILGLLFFIIAERDAEDSRGIWLTVLTLWLAQSIRFSQVLGTDIRAFSLSLLCSLPFTAIIACGITLDRLFIRNNHPVAALFMVPVFYTAAVLVFALVKLGNIANLTTYVMCIPHLSGNLNWLGEYGMTFAVMLILSFIAAIVTTDIDRLRKISAAAAVALIGLLFIIGTLYNSGEIEPDFTLNIAIGLCEKTDFSDCSESKSSRISKPEVFGNIVKSAAESGADLLVLNEKFYYVEDGDEDSAMGIVSETVKEYGIPALICFDIAGEDGEKRTNKVVFFDSEGNALETYIKRNPVPFIESGKYTTGKGKPGTLTYDFNGHEVNISFALGFDINNTVYMGKVPKDTELLIIPSLGWDKCSIEQRRTFIRSVEHNTTLLKHSYEGFTYVSTPFGVYGEMSDNRGAYESLRITEVPIWEKGG